jgi:hypothetical protein
MELKAWTAGDDYLPASISKTVRVSESGSELRMANAVPTGNGPLSVGVDFADGESVTTVFGWRRGPEIAMSKPQPPRGLSWTAGDWATWSGGDYPYGKCVAMDDDAKTWMDHYREWQQRQPAKADAAGIAAAHRIKPDKRWELKHDKSAGEAIHGPGKSYIPIRNPEVAKVLETALRGDLVGLAAALEELLKRYPA